MRRAFAALALAGAIGLAGPARSDAPALRFHGNAADPAYGSVDLAPIDAAAMARLRDIPGALWRAAFPVRVDDADCGTADAAPAILGSYALLPDGVRFIPRYPPVPGVAYRAEADLSVLLGISVPATLAFSVPRVTSVPSTVVDRVFPSGDALPENLLRFYIHFSAPMQGGDAADHVLLLGPDGRPAAAAFLRLATELWDPAMRRLTLLLDPGRIKRGIGPNRALGPPLRRGEAYTLVVDPGMRDAAGQPLLRGIAKPFRALTPVRARVDPAAWGIDLPRAGTQQTLALRFPAALDEAALSRAIRVVDADRRPIAGRIGQDRHETRWTFTPSSAWVAGPYAIEVDPNLEDVSGNTPMAAFDAEVGAGAGKGESHRVVLPIVLDAGTGR